MKMRRCLTAVLVPAVLLTLAPLTYGQASRTGNTFAIGGSPLVLLPDVAYDTARNRYLTIVEAASHTAIQGQFVDANGGLVGSLFTVSTTPGGYTQYPRVAFSPDVNSGNGGFLVVWHEIPPGGNFAQVRGKILSADGTALTGNILISTEAVSVAASTCWIMGAPVAYSTTSHEFLVAWMGSYNTGQEIRFMRVGLTGNLLQSAVTTVTAGTSDWERDPAVAYNPDRDEFLVVYAGYWDAPYLYGYVATQRVKAGTGALIGARTELGAMNATLIPTVAYNTTAHQYVVAWYNRSPSLAAFYGITLNSDASTASNTRVMSAYYYAYDALDLKFQPQSHDYLLVTYGRTPLEYEDAAVSIKPDGTPYDNGFVLTATGDKRGNFSPRIAASTVEKKWLTVMSTGFASAAGQFVVSGSTGGGGTTPPPPPPPSPPPPTPPVTVSSVTQTGGLTSFAAGTPITLTANASGGTNLQYQFWRFNVALSQWQLAKPYSSTNSFTWNTSGIDAGWQKVQVWVKSASSSAQYDAFMDSSYFFVTTPSPVLHAFTTLPGGNIAPGALVKIQAIGAGGSGVPLEYQFWRYSYVTGRWSLDRPYGTTDFYGWQTTVSDEGSYALQVWVRQQGSSAPYENWTGMQLNVSNVSVASVGASVPTTRAGNAVNLFALGNGCSASCEYKFWVYTENHGWTLARDYSTNPNYAWVTSSANIGNNIVQVWVRSNGSSASYAAWANSGVFVVVP